MTTSILGDFGAEVIKIERPGHGDPIRWNHHKDGIGLMYKVQARNKRCVTLDLKSDQGREMFHELVRQSDVVVENFRPGVMERLGNDWATLQTLNDRLVFCRISGWGQSGPYSHRASLGRIAEAFSGFSEITGEPAGPPMHSTMALGDSTCAVWAANAVMLALYWRDAQGGGKGQLIDLGLYEPLFRQIEQQIIVADATGEPLTRMGNLNPGAPVMGSYQTADGRWFSFSANTERSIRSVIAAFGLDGDPRFDGFDACLAHRTEFHEHASAWIGARTSDDIAAVFDTHGAPGSPVMNAADLLADPQVRHREMIITVPDEDLGPVRMQGIVPKLTRTPGRVTHAGERMGQSNDEIYGRLLGTTAAELASLRDRGII